MFSKLVNLSSRRGILTTRSNRIKQHRNPPVLPEYRMTHGNMTQIFTEECFGIFPDQVPSSEEYLTLHFSPSFAPRKYRWSNYGLSADFLGDYFAAFFPGDEVPDSKINRRDSVKATVSYMANELLENAVKYSDETAGLPISITLNLYEQGIIFQVINHATLPRTELYQQFIHTLLSSDLDELYTQHLEQAALGTGESNMGVLTMIHDYAAKFGWKFQKVADQRELVRVTVMAHLEL